MSIAALAPQIWHFVNELRLRGKIIFSLTRDAFFRYSEMGELVFLNAVIASRGKPLLIEEMAAELCLEGTSKKTLPLKLLRIGIPTDRGNATHDHFFFSSSPLDLIPVGQPVRRVYLFAVGDYDNTLVEAFSDLRSRAAMIATREAETESDREKALSEAKNAGETFLTKYFEGVQLEPGDYRVMLTIRYQEADNPGVSKMRTERSSLRFEVPSDFRENVRYLMRLCIGDVFRQHVQKETEVRYPNFEPKAIRVERPSE